MVSDGKIQVESKDDIRKRIGRSTDAGDAVVQAFFTKPHVWTSMMVEGPVGGRRDEVRMGSAVDQIRKVFPFAFTEPDRSYLCSNCALLVPPVEGETRGRCLVNPGLMVVGDELACPEWEAR